jgi:hypothetical protein
VCPASPRNGPANTATPRPVSQRPGQSGLDHRLDGTAASPDAQTACQGSADNQVNHVSLAVSRRAWDALKAGLDQAKVLMLAAMDDQR